MGGDPRCLERRIHSVAHEPSGHSAERQRGTGLYVGDGFGGADAAVLSLRIRVRDPYGCREIRSGRVWRQTGHPNSVGTCTRARRTEPTPTRSGSRGGGEPAAVRRKPDGAAEVWSAGGSTGVRRQRTRADRDRSSGTEYALGRHFRDPGRGGGHAAGAADFEQRSQGAGRTRGRGWRRTAWGFARLCAAHGMEGEQRRTVDESGDSGGGPGDVFGSGQPLSDLR